MWQGVIIAGEFVVAEVRHCRGSLLQEVVVAQGIELLSQEH
jgi:hypothetical protein